MIYAVVVRVPSKDQQLAEALREHPNVGSTPRKVYVVGMSEEDTLAAALDDTLTMYIEDPDSTTLMRFKWVETIGTESSNPRGEIDNLVALAKNRAEQLQRKNPSPLARIAA